MEQTETTFTLPEFSAAGLSKMNTAEIAAEMDKQTEARDELFARMSDEYASDQSWDGRQDAYKALGETIRLVDANISRAETALGRAHSREDNKPLRKQSALNRAYHAWQNRADKDATQGLEADEIKSFIPPDADAFRADGGYMPESLVATRRSGFAFRLGEDPTAPSVVPKLYAAPQLPDDPIVPHTASMRVRERLVYFGNVGANVVNMNSPDANPHYEMYRDSTGTKGKVFKDFGNAVTEADHANFKSVKFGGVEIQSNELPISTRLIQHVQADVRGHILREGLRGIAEPWNNACVNQKTAPPEENMSDVMQSLITMAADQTMALGSKDAITHDEIKAWVRKLPYDLRVNDEGNPYGYRRSGEGGMLGFMMHSTLFDLICDLDDDDGRPLWHPIPTSSLASGAGGLIKGYPYAINNAFGEMGTSNNVPGVILNGNCFTQRNCGDIWVRFFDDSRTRAAGNRVSYMLWDLRFFAPNSELSAGTGIDDATRSFAVARITLP